MASALFMSRVIIKSRIRRRKEGGSAGSGPEGAGAERAGAEGIRTSSRSKRNWAAGSRAWKDQKPQNDQKEQGSGPEREEAGKEGTALAAAGMQQPEQIERVWPLK